MIKFTLACEREHEFESWFPDNAAYEEQARRGFVVCPECSSHRIAKAPMAPAVLTHRRGKTYEPRPVAVACRPLRLEQLLPLLAVPLRLVAEAARRISEHAQRHLLDRVSVVLHGGEPLLLGRERLNGLLSTLRSVIDPVARLALGIAIELQQLEALARGGLFAPKEHDPQFGGRRQAAQPVLFL